MRLEASLGTSACSNANLLAHKGYAPSCGGGDVQRMRPLKPWPPPRPLQKVHLCTQNTTPYFSCEHGRDKRQEQQQQRAEQQAEVMATTWSNELQHWRPCAPCIRHTACLTSAMAPLMQTTANGWKGVSASDSAVAAFGVLGRDALTCKASVQRCRRACYQFEARPQQRYIASDPPLTA